MIRYLIENFKYLVEMADILTLRKMQMVEMLSRRGFFMHHDNPERWVRSLTRSTHVVTDRGYLESHIREDGGWQIKHLPSHKFGGQWYGSGTTNLGIFGAQLDQAIQSLETKGKSLSPVIIKKPRRR